MFFSTLHNYSKANELIEKAKNIIANSKERIREAKEKLLEEASKNDSLKDQFNIKGINRFQKLAQKLKNEPPIEIAPVKLTLLIKQVEPLIKESETESPEIVKLKHKRGIAIFLAILAALITIASALLIGTFATDIPVTLETFQNYENLKNILAWIGGGAFNPQMANPIWGAIGLAALSIAIGTMTWTMTLSKRSKENLAISESMLMDANSYESEMNEVINRMQNLTELLKSYRANIEICDAYVNEYNATIHRIILTEGDDFEKFKPSSKLLIERASVTISAIIPHLNIAIMTTENRVTDQLIQAIDDTKKLVEDLIEEKPITS